MRPLIALDVNSNIDYLTLFKFISSLLKRFDNIDITFVGGDGSIIKVENNEVFKISDSFSVIELVKELRKIVEDGSEGNLNVNSLIKLKKELNRSILIIVSDKKIKDTKELVFIFDGKRVKLLRGN